MNLEMVFEGGGAKGAALIGAWDVLQTAGFEPGRMVGTSAGAIVATILAAGYTVQEMHEALAEQKEGKSVMAGFLGAPTPPTPEELTSGALASLLADVDLPFVPAGLEATAERRLLALLARQERFHHLFSLVERGGWYGAGRFVSWMAQRLDTGAVAGKPRRFSHMTFAEFHAATGHDLSLVASDTYGQQMLVLNHRTAPDCPVVWAVRMSMNIPLLWEEVVWQESWGDYLGRSMTGHTVVDGGLLSNFPMELLLSDLAGVVMAMGQPTGNPVLGLLIDERLALPNTRGILDRIGVDVMGLTTVQRILRLVDTTLTARDKLVMDAYRSLVVRLPAYGYGTTEFDMSEARRRALIDAAQDATRRHLRTNPVGVATRGMDDQRQAAVRTANQIAVGLFD